MITPAPRLWQRMAALSILFAIVGAAAFGILAPVVAVLDPDNSEHDLLRSRWVSYEAAARTQHALEAELSQIRTREGQIAGRLSGNTSALAAAALQNDVKAIVERNGGEIRSARILPAASSGAFERVSVHYDLSIPMSALERLLYQIETHQPYLFLDSIDIMMPENWLPSGGAPEPKLSLRWQVSGYRWTGVR